MADVIRNDPVEILANLLDMLWFLEADDPRFNYDQVRPRDVLRDAETGDLTLILPWGQASVSCDEIRGTIDPLTDGRDRQEAYTRLAKQLWTDAGTWKKG